jgi:thiaminase/transcriptional activator TenA
VFARLHDAAAPTRARILEHPFVRGLGDGTLAPERFRYYMGQDYVFLIQYSRVLALAAARADEPAVAARFADLLTLTLNVEMDLHRRSCERLGITPERLEATRPAPTTVAYTNHLRLVAETQDLPGILAAILPCAYGYWEIAAALRARSLPEHEAYADWIQMYTSDDYEAMAHWAAALLDRVGDGQPPARQEALCDVFMLSQRYEYLFWDMSWRMEEWPI